MPSLCFESAAELDVFINKLADALAKRLSPSVEVRPISYEQLATEYNTTKKTIGQMVKRSHIEPVQMGRGKGILPQDKKRLR